MPETVNFNTIAEQLADVTAAGDQILAEYRDNQPNQTADQATQEPFGVELFTETDENLLRLGEVACVRSLSSKVDDVSTYPEDGNPPFMDTVINTHEALSLF